MFCVLYSSFLALVSFQHIPPGHNAIFFSFMGIPKLFATFFFIIIFALLEKRLTSSLGHFKRNQLMILIQLLPLILRLHYLSVTLVPIYNLQVFVRSLLAAK